VFVRWQLLHLEKERIREMEWYLCPSSDILSNTLMACELGILGFQR
jgi:hypothetical protein